MSKQNQRRYWVMALGEKSEYWLQCREHNIIALGWDIGDLNNYANEGEIEKTLRHQYPQGYISQGRKDLYAISKEMKKGDIVYIREGTHKIIARGVICGENCRYEGDAKEKYGIDYKNIRDVVWSHKDANFNVAVNTGNRSLYSKPEYGKFEELFLVYNTNFPKNLILYGPPGTGKTRNTVLKALKIINPQKEYDDYNEALEDFRKYKEEKRIAFVTFHQSYAYEEFVEGIKPVLDNNDTLSYQNKPGIFREICTHAHRVENNNFETLYQKLLADLKAKDELIFKTTRRSKEFKVKLNTNGNLTVITNKTSMSITKEYLQECYDTDEAELWLPYCRGIIEAYRSKNEQKKPYVLIIDEINRGNISKIFGELITLIEDDKRGKWSAILPYSGDDLTVPENLYIIGTMNTADRSIATMDIALRRRFKFEEMMPEPELDEIKENSEKIGINLSALIKNLNYRITALLDHDHQIGHSYFIRVTDIQKLREVWFGEIIPLLNEYFYGDWDKLKMVLGNDSIFIKELGEFFNEKVYEFTRSEAINDENFAEELNKITKETKL